MAEASPPDWPARYAPRMAGIVGSDIRARMKLLGDRRIIHLGGGLPDPAILPVDTLHAAADAILGDPARARVALQYAPSEGHPPLRAWIAAMLTESGAPCTADNVMITNGSQQALDLLARLFVGAGDTVLVEVPSFIGALRAFDSYEPHYRALPEGSALEGPLPAACMAYAGTEFRNPTGTSLPSLDRERLVARAIEAGIPLVEDGCYERLRYSGEPLSSLFVLGARAAGGVERSPVLHAGTFSKIVAPSLRVGWVAGPAEVISRLVLLKQAADLATSALNQMMLLEVVSTRLDALTRNACDVYRTRRDSMLAALAEQMPEEVCWTEPEGGLYIWLTLPEAIDGVSLARRALEECSTSIIAGGAFYPRGIGATPRNHVRLSFSFIGVDEAREGVERLGALARRMLDEAQSASAAVTAISSA